MATSIGTQEFDLLGRGPVPFEVRLAVDFENSSARFDLLDNYEGADFRELAKIQKAIDQLAQTGQFEIFSLRHNRSLFRGTIDENSFQAWAPDFAKWVNAIATVSDAYGVPLRFTEQWTEEDRRALILLEGFLHGISLPVSNLSFVVTKDENLERAFSGSDAPSIAVRLILPEFNERLTLLGVHISTGPLIFSIENAAGAADAATRAKIREAAVGDPVSISISSQSQALVKRYDPDGSRRTEPKHSQG